MGSLVRVLPLSFFCPSVHPSVHPSFLPFCRFRTLPLRGFRASPLRGFRASPLRGFRASPARVPRESLARAPRPVLSLQLQSGLAGHTAQGIHPTWAAPGVVYGSVNTARAFGELVNFHHRPPCLRLVAVGWLWECGFMALSDVYHQC